MTNRRSPGPRSPQGVRRSTATHRQFTREVGGQARGGGGGGGGNGGRWWCGRGVGAGVVYVRVRVICVGPRVFSGAIGISIPHCGAITPANRLGVLAVLFRGGVAEAV